MSIKRPISNVVDAHFFSKEGATHAPDDLHYLISSKGQSNRIPLARSCANFNGTDNEAAFTELGNVGGQTLGFQLYLNSDVDQDILFKGVDKVLSINQATQEVTINTWNGSIVSIDKVFTIDQNGAAIPLNTWFSLIFVLGDSGTARAYIDGIQGDDISESDQLFFDEIVPSEEIKLYELFYYTGSVWNAAAVLKISKLNYNLLGPSFFYPDFRWHFEEKTGSIFYDNGIGNNSNDGAITGTLTNFWYEGADVPYNFSNKNGYTLGGSSQIVPAQSNVLDALGNTLEEPQEVRQRAKVIDVNIGDFATNSYQVQFAAFVVGFTFTNEGTATGVAISGAGLLTVTGAGTLYDLKIFDGSILVNHYSFNEGQAKNVYDLVADNNGVWVAHTDPNQWAKSDDAIDYELINTKLRGGSKSKIDFNPYLALSEDVPTDYAVGDAISASAFMHLNQTFIPSPTFGSEADDAISNMSIGTPYERQFVAEFVEELLAQGNHGLIDDLMLLGLRGGSGLKMMKGSVVPVNNGGVFIDGIGSSFAGAEWIDTLWNPTVDNVSFAQNDALHGIFVKKVGLDGNFWPYGAGASTGANAMNAEGLWAVNAGGFFNSNLDLLDDALYLCSRIAVATSNLYRNGVSIDFSASNSVGADSETFNIGAVENAGIPLAHFTGIISAFLVGAGVGFAHLDFYNSLTKVQTKIELGNQIKDILIYNSELVTADDVRRLDSYINEI